MKKLIGLFSALLLVSPVMADDVAIASEHASAAWVVIGDDVYLCTIREPASVENPICYEADMKD